MKDDKLPGRLTAAIALPLIFAPAAIQLVQWCRGKTGTADRPLSNIWHTLKTGYALE